MLNPSPIPRVPLSQPKQSYVVVEDTAGISIQYEAGNVTLLIPCHPNKYYVVVVNGCGASTR